MKLTTKVPARTAPATTMVAHCRYCHIELRRRIVTFQGEDIVTDRAHMQCPNCFSLFRISKIHSCVHPSPVWIEVADPAYDLWLALWT